MFDTAKRAINEYLKDSYKQDQASMLESLLDTQNLEKFIYMKTYGDGRAAAWLNAKDKSDTSTLGLVNPLSEEFKNNVLPDFLPYAFAEFTQYRANRKVEIGKKQDKQQISALATMKVAKLLNLSHLVVKTEYVNLHIPNSTDKVGIIMECADGISFKQLKSSKIQNIDPSFQLSVSNLMVLDAICAQRDRSVGNYFTTISPENTITGVSAYDNELAFGSYTDLTKPNYRLPAIIDSDGTLVLPHMDKTPANSILSINDKDIHENLKELLDDKQISDTIVRIDQIKNAIKKSIDKNKSFLLESNEWNKETMDEECSIDNENIFQIL